MSLSTPTYVLSGLTYLVGGDSVTLSAVDPISNGVAAGGTAFSSGIGVEAEDDGSGVAWVSLSQLSGGEFSSTVTFGGGDWQEADFPASSGTVLSSGLYLAQAADLVGNVSSATFTLVVDTAPGIVLALGEPEYGTGPIFVATDTPVGFTVSDDTSVSEIEYAVDSDSFSVYSSSFSLPTEGPHVVSWYGVDWLDNAGPVSSAAITADATPPVTSVSFSTPVYFGLDGSTEIADISYVTLTATDALSGVQSTLWDLDGNPWNQYTTPFAVPLGTHTLAFFSTDNVGNTESPNIFQLTVQATSSTVTTLLPGLSNPSPTVRQQTVRALQFYSDPTAFSAIASVLANDTDWQTRQEAVPAIANYKYAASVSALSVTLSSDPVGYNRIAAASYLSYIAGASAIPALSQSLNDPNPLVQLKAAAELGRQGNTSGAAVAQNFINSTDPETRAAAAEALGTIGNPQSISVLTQLASNTNEDGDVKLAATMAVQHIQLLQLPSSQQLTYLVQALSSQQWALRFWAANEMALRHDSATVAALETIAVDPNNIGAGEAAAALATQLGP